MRPDGWEEALARAIERHSLLPFEWGVSDCFMMATDAAEAATGSPVLAEYRRYTTEVGAARVMRRAGVEDVGNILALHLTPIAPALAQRGDLGVIERDGTIAAGVFTSFGFAVKAQHGVFYEPVTSVARAFKV
jgi:hypothetical protein